jgi:hypothetical protein
LRYFGNWSNALIEQDFSRAELQDFTLRKQILFGSEDKLEVRPMEGEIIPASTAAPTMARGRPSSGIRQPATPRVARQTS